MPRICPDQDSSQRMRFIATRESWPDDRIRSGSKRPIKGGTDGVGLDFAKAYPIGRSAKRVGVPACRVAFHITIFNAQAHVLVDREANARESLPGEHSIAIGALEVNII